MVAYPTYQISGIHWLENIPEHWKMHKIKYLFEERIEKGFPNEPLLAATQSKGVTLKELYENRTVIAQKDLDLLKLVEVGDFVISLRSFQGGIEYTYYRGIISPAYTIMKISNNLLLADYFRYLAKSQIFIGLLKTCVTGIREGQNINYDYLKNHYVPLPSLDEQQQIVRYLDWKTTKISKFIKLKKNLITHLREQLTNLSFGNKNNSQIIGSDNWKNLFPSHWSFEKSKRLFSETSIKNNIDKELLAVTQDRGVLPKKICSQNYVSPAGTLKGLKLIKKNDFIISLRSFQGGIEFSSYDGIVSPAYTILELKTDFKDSKYYIFYRHLFKSPNFIKLLNTVITGVRDGKNISFFDFSKLDLPIPPRDELDEIVEAHNEFEKIKSLTEKEIELLQEYQIRLISDVVTGKIDVRSIQVPDFEPIEVSMELSEKWSSEESVMEDIKE